MTHRTLRVMENPGYIQVVLTSECRSIDPERWAPAFRVRIIDHGKIAETANFYARDIALTFQSKDEADRYADIAAHDYCAKEYPGWIIFRGGPIEPKN